MRFTFEVLVTLKPGLADPAGQGRGGVAAGPRVLDERLGRARRASTSRLDVEAPTQAQARTQVEEMARRLLSNPVIEDFRVLETPKRAEPSRIRP